MSNIADLIENYILRQLAAQEDGHVELRRTEIAFPAVPTRDGGPAGAGMKRDRKRRAVPGPLPFAAKKNDEILIRINPTEYTGDNDGDYRIKYEGYDKPYDDNPLVIKDNITELRKRVRRKGADTEAIMITTDGSLIMSKKASSYRKAKRLLIVG